MVYYYQILDLFCFVFFHVAQVLYFFFKLTDWSELIHLSFWENISKIIHK